MQQSALEYHRLADLDPAPSLITPRAEGAQRSGVAKERSSPSPIPSLAPLPVGAQRLEGRWI